MSGSAAKINILVDASGYIPIQFNIFISHLIQVSNPFQNISININLPKLIRIINSFINCNTLGVNLYLHKL